MEGLIYVLIASMFVKILEEVGVMVQVDRNRNLKNPPPPKKLLDNLLPWPRQPIR